MTDSSPFVDTNILVYAHDLDAGKKHVIARDKIKDLWQRTVPPCTSIQVLQELYVNLIRKGAACRTARDIVMNYLRWEIVVNDGPLLLRGMECADRWRLSFWDGLIVAAAIKAEAKLLWSEDLNSGQNYGGVIVVNPLAE